MSFVALETPQHPQHQRMRNEEVNNSSGYSSQEGDAILVAATSYLSRLNPQQLEEEGEPITSTNDTITNPSPRQNARKLSSSQVTQVSDYDGTVSGIIPLNLATNSLMYTAQSAGEVSRSVSTMLGRKCFTPQCSCCQRSEQLMRINEEFAQQKLDLEERNQGLSEEIQVSRRFYQGTLADLTAQLSIGMSYVSLLSFLLLLFFNISL